MKKEILNKIMAKVEELKNDDDFWFEFIGVRVQEQEFELGEVKHNSSVWVDGDETDEELDGICAIDVNKLAYVKVEYPGEHMAIIASNRAHAGEDIGEIVMSDAQVVAIIK